MKIYFDFNDWWIGYYRGSRHHFLCPLPTVVIRWDRKIKGYLHPNSDYYRTSDYLTQARNEDPSFTKIGNRYYSIDSELQKKLDELP